MAIRLTPGGGEGYAGPGQRAGAGLFAGIADVGDALLKKGLGDQQFQRQTGRELLKDYTDKVAAGTLEPEQASAAMAAQGFHVPATYFSSLQPTVEHELQKIVGGVTKASSPQEVIGRTALTSEPVLKRIPFKSKLTDVASQPDASVPGGDTLASTQLSQFSPELDRLMAIRSEKLNAFAPTKVDTVDAQGNPVTTFASSNPESLTGRSFQKEASPDLAGRRKAAEVLAQAGAENAGGLPTMKGQAFTQQADLERGARAATAGAESGASTNARIGAETSPANVTREASRQSAITSATTAARQAAERAGIPTDIANNYVNGTLTGRSYAAIPSEVPNAERSVIIDSLAKSGIKLIDKNQAGALAGIDKARADYNDLMNRFQGHLSADAKGRPLSSVTNKLGVYLQTDPQLAAAVATSFPQLISLLKANASAMGGGVGRIMQIEVERMAPMLPLPSDSWASAQQKKLAVAHMLLNAENAILGQPTQVSH